MTRKKLTIHRKGYTRKAYTRKDGTRVKATHVPPTTFKRKDVGAPGRGKKVIKVEPGKLTKYGYSTSKSAKERRRALKKAINAYGSTAVWRMLNAQVIFRKRTDGNKKKFEADRDWVKEQYNPRLKPTKAIKKWKGMSPRERAKRMPGG